jgi:hypothetical protein
MVLMNRRHKQPQHHVSALQVLPTPIAVVNPTLDAASHLQKGLSAHAPPPKHHAQDSPVPRVEPVFNHDRRCEQRLQLSSHACRHQEPAHAGELPQSCRGQAHFARLLHTLGRPRFMRARAKCAEALCSSQRSWCALHPLSWAIADRSIRRRQSARAC